MKINSLVVFALAISLLGNLYLFNMVLAWQNAWLAQIMTTGDIEQIIRYSGYDISFDRIKEIIENDIESEYEIVNIDETGLEMLWKDDLNKETIRFNDTWLVFKDNNYIGSGAILPRYIEYWTWVNEP